MVSGTSNIPLVTVLGVAETAKEKTRVPTFEARMRVGKVALVDNGIRSPPDRRARTGALQATDLFTVATLNKRLRWTNIVSRAETGKENGVKKWMYTVRVRDNRKGPGPGDPT